MKKQLVMLLAVAAMAGCSKNETVDAPTGGDTPIKVKTFVKKSSKATLITNAAFTSFQMVAYQADKATGFPGGVNLTPFIAEVAVNKGEDNAWSYTGPKYWPEGKKVSFFGYAPASALTLTAATTDTWPGFDYTIKAETAQEDVIVASAIDQTADGGGSVSLNFSHLLSQILFTVTSADPTDFKMEVTKIEITGVNSKCTYTFTSAGGAWGTPSTPANYIYSEATVSILTTEQAVTGPGASKSLMLMPQTLPGDAKLAVTYKATANTGSVVTFNGTKTVALTGEWKAGMKYIYDLVLPTGGTQISVVPSVDDNWTEAKPTAPTM